MQHQPQLDDFYALPPAQQAEVIDFIQRLKHKHAEGRRSWQEIAGLSASPIMPEDAQTWISEQRQQADRIAST
jgi:hypothetical protein